MSFTSEHLYFDDIQVGQQWESLGRTVTEADIIKFAGLSGDFNPIHVDHAFAKETPYRMPIAHGLLVLSIAGGLGLYNPPMRTLVGIEIRSWNFRRPVFIGDTLRLRVKVLEKIVKVRRKRGQVTWQRQIVNQDRQVVQEGVTVTLVEARNQAAGDRAGAAASEPEQVAAAPPRPKTATT